MRLTHQAWLALCLLGGCGQAASQNSDPTDTRFVAKARAIDGDTVAVSFRLLGVDAFERRQLCSRAGACWPCGKAAQDMAAKALRDQNVRITLTPGRTYGRPVAIVDVAGGDLGERMIRAGLAVPAPQYLASDPGRAARYAQAFEAARRAGIGAHAGTWLDPADWRHGKRLTCEADINRISRDRDTRRDPA